MSKDLSLRSFVTAGAIMAAAVGVRAALDRPLPQTPPFITLYPAVALSGLYCGPFAGAAASLAGVLAAIYLWIPPRLSFAAPTLTDAVAIALFMSTSAVVLWATSLLRAQRKLAEFGRHAQDLGLAAGGVGTWEIDLRTLRITASRAAYAMHHLPQTDAQTRPEDWLRGIHPEDAAAASTALQAAVAGGELASYTYRIFGGPDGTRWISARGRVVASGGERRLLCALVDITEQVRVQDELRRERERLRLALAAGGLAVWDYHTATGEVMVDTRYAATTGLEPGTHKLTRAQIGARIHPDDVERVAAEHDAMATTGADYQIEYRIITPSGDIRWLMSQGILIKDDLAGDSGRLVGIIQDVTERRQREEDLRDLAALRELLIREADHRIKNSLQLVVSLLTSQMRGIEDKPAADALRGAIARVGAIAASHLALQRSEDLRQIDLAVTLRELCGHFAQLHPSIAIICRPQGPLLLDADRAILLGLAVSEVLTNALRHAFADGRSGTVSVEAKTEAGELLLTISDDGVGMEQRPAGDGLGSRIIGSLAGRLAASLHIDTAPQAGTVVTLRVPMLHQSGSAS